MRADGLGSVNDDIERETWFDTCSRTLFENCGRTSSEVARETYLKIGNVAPMTDQRRFSAAEWPQGGDIDFE